MLYHHDGRDYQVAASEAANYARGLFEKQIEKGRTSVAKTIDTTLGQVPEDAIVTAAKLNFVANGHLRLSAGESYERDLHPHAVGQIASRAGVPSKYVNDLLGAPAEEGWKRELLAHVLREHYSHEKPGTKYLARSVQGQIRGFLSDRYRRLDCRPILDAFLQACMLLHAIPISGTITDTRCALKCVLPWVFEPVPNEVMLIGVQFGNSDFGAGKVSLRGFIDRLFCTNYATLEDYLATIHLGAQLPEGIEFSQKTYELDTDLTISKVRDTVQGVLGPDAVHRVLGGIKSANEQEVDWRAVSRRLANVLTKTETEQVKTAFDSDDVVMLPAGATTWRLSNAVSWIANNADVTDERKLELERLAGEIAIPTPRKVKAAEEAAAADL